MTTPRDAFRQNVADTLRDWRLGCIAPRSNNAIVFIFREAVADIIRFRLTIAYMPLMQTLERIQKRCAVLESLKRDPWSGRDDG